MDIPIRFSHPADVIADETERFRRLDAAGRVQELGEATEVADWQLRHFARTPEIEAEIEEFERSWQRAHRKVFEDYERRRSSTENN